MQAELNSDVALSAANALVSHLRKNPEAALSPAQDLATTFGLDESFVAQVLQGIHADRRPEARPAHVRRGLFRTVGGFVGGLWLRLTSRPVLFVIVTQILCYVGIVCALYFVPKWVPNTVSTQAKDATFPAKVVVILLVCLALMGGTFLLHMGTYFRHRSARNAVYGGLFVFGSLTAFFGISMIVSPPKVQQNEPAPIVLFLVAAMGLLMLSLMYVGVGSLAAVLGNWARFKLQEQAEETMSRQDMLERYFELQSRLQKSAYPRPAGQMPAIFGSSPVLWYRRNQFLANLILGFALEALALLAYSASGIKPGDPQTQINAWFFVLMFISIAEFMLFIVQGYLSKTAWRAIVGACCVVGGSLLAQTLFVNVLSFTSVRMNSFGPAGMVVAEAGSIILNSLVSCAGYLAAVVQNRVVREANLQRNDQATLLAEMVRLQWKLSNEAGTVCVLVVDAAKSSEMKAAADPLVVEYTFREYQEWIEAISVQRGGRVHSTAGDGAVVAFNTCGLALSAARRIQTDLFQFNKEVNRLSQPFKLRIGIHTGEVAGDINQVQFTEVIDIAAHIESACPIGGIAVTEDVAQRLPDEQFTPLNVRVDGHDVLLVTNATEFQ